VELIKPGRQFDFMGKRRYFIGASVLLLFLSVVSFFYPGFRLGTDFKGGTEVEIALRADVPVADVRAAVHRAGFEAPEVVSVADKENPNRVLIRVQEVSALTEAQKNAIRERLCLETEGAPLPEDRCPPAARASEIRFSPGGDKIAVRYEAPPDLGAIAARLRGLDGVALRGGPSGVVLANERDHKVDVHLSSKGDQLVDGLRREIGADKVPEQALRVEWVGPKAGAQLRDAALRSVAIAIFFIMAYIAIRFDLRFAPGGIIALVHDVGIAMGAMAITGREVTISTVAAMLTIVGYSINDTVIVYDRIRENLSRHRGLSFAAVINLSISEMLGRTIITSGVTALSMVAFLVWGTGVLRDFAFALLVGIGVGTYSSIYIAAPITEWIDKRFFGASAAQRKAVTRTRAEKKKDAVV
jgi:preprotein translocase subunit SecF